MKLAQFKTKQTGLQRLALSLDDAVIDVADLARAVLEAGGG
jgi:hypothetical protein